MRIEGRYPCMHMCCRYVFRFRNNTDGIHTLNPFLRSHRKIVMSGFILNWSNSTTDKIRVVQLFPYKLIFPGLYMCIAPIQN